MKYYRNNTESDLYIHKNLHKLSDEKTEVFSVTSSKHYSFYYRIATPFFDSNPQCDVIKKLDKRWAKP